MGTECNVVGIQTSEVRQNIRGGKSNTDSRVSEAGKDGKQEEDEIKGRKRAEAHTEKTLIFPLKCDPNLIPKQEKYVTENAADILGHFYISKIIITVVD